MKIIRKKDGTEEVEGTPEELAEFEKKSKVEESEGKKESKTPKGKKELLKDHYQRASKEEREEVKTLVLQELAEGLKDFMKPKAPHEDCPGIVERGVDHDVYRAIKRDLDDIKVRLVPQIVPQVVPVPVPCDRPHYPTVRPWWETQITWSSGQTNVGPDGKPIQVIPLTVTNDQVIPMTVDSSRVIPMAVEPIVSIPTVFHVGN